MSQAILADRHDCMTTSQSPVGGPVLLVCPFIDPTAVGEPRWCYDLAKALSSRIETTIITQTPRNRTFRIAELFPESTVHEHPPWSLGAVPPRVHALFKPNYLRFYREARKVLTSKLRLQDYKCAHHFGPLGLRFPTPLRGTGLPYIIGPLGGSLPTPAAFVGQTIRQPWYYRFRDFDALRFRHDPFLRGSYEGADCLVGAAPYVKELLGSLSLKRFAVRPEIAARMPGPETEMALLERQQFAPPLRFLVVSRLIFSKGVQFALQAAAIMSSNEDWQMDILGDGPMRQSLEASALELGIADKVRFHGHIPRAQVDDFYRRADVFVFPSIREPSGAVIFEAMSWGLPMIAAAYGGPAHHVRPEYGLLASVQDPKTYVTNLATAMASLLHEPARRIAMGRAAAKAAAETESLESMADFYINLYQEISRGRLGQ